MTRFLPPQLFALFEARPPTQAWEPEPRSRKPVLSGVAAFIDKFEDPMAVEKKLEEPKAEDAAGTKATIESDRPNTGLVPRAKEIKSRKRKRIREAEMESIAKRMKTCMRSDYTIIISLTNINIFKIGPLLLFSAISNPLLARLFM